MSDGKRKILGAAGEAIGDWLRRGRAAEHAVEEAAPVARHADDAAPAARHADAAAPAARHADAAAPAARHVETAAPAAAHAEAAAARRAESIARADTVAENPGLRAGFAKDKLSELRPGRQGSIESFNAALADSFDDMERAGMILPEVKGGLTRRVNQVLLPQDAETALRAGRPISSESAQGLADQLTHRHLLQTDPVRAEQFRAALDANSGVRAAADLPAAGVARAEAPAQYAAPQGPGWGSRMASRAWTTTKGVAIAGAAIVAVDQVAGDGQLLNNVKSYVGFKGSTAMDNAEASAVGAEVQTGTIQAYRDAANGTGAAAPSGTPQQPAAPQGETTSGNSMRISDIESSVTAESDLYTKGLKPLADQNNISSMALLRIVQDTLHSAVSDKGQLLDQSEFSAYSSEFSQGLSEKLDRTDMTAAQKSTVRQGVEQYMVRGLSMDLN